jgi:hypothetical protein
MYEFKDLARLTSVATVLVVIFGTVDFLSSVTEFVKGPPVEGSLDLAGLLAVAELLTLIACIIVVGRWIYRASANAHAMNVEMTITPGWAVGWYFVPIANLYKPFHAMREIWWASHESQGGYEERAPQLVGWWWGLWIITNILANVAWRLGELGVGPTLDLVASMLNVALCIVLIMIMREITTSQRHVRHVLAFA